MFTRTGESRSHRLRLLLAAGLVAAMAAAASAEKPKRLDVDGAVQVALRDTADKREAKPSSPPRKTLGGFRVGSCKSSAPGAPTTSWPARGETAISLCKP